MNIITLSHNASFHWSHILKTHEIQLGLLHGVLDDKEMLMMVLLVFGKNSLWRKVLSPCRSALEGWMMLLLSTSGILFLKSSPC